MAVLERMGIATGIDLWTLQDVADRIVRGEVMQRPIEIDRLTATMGYASVPASYLLHAIRAGERFGLDPRDLIVELGRRRVVVGQEDAIIGIAAAMAEDARHRPMITAVLDDDPTGTQAMADVPIVLDWSDGAVATAVREGDPSVHLLTNSRAHPAAAAAAVTASAARAGAGGVPGRAAPAARRQHAARPRLRGVRRRPRPRSASGRRRCPLLLVPAFPAAGRVTIDGVHLLERDGERDAAPRDRVRDDGASPTGDARLAQWADERSGGSLAAADAVEIPLARGARADGAEAICGRAGGDPRPRPAGGRGAGRRDGRRPRGDRRAACAPPRRQVPVMARCAPAFAAIVTGTAAQRLGGAAGRRAGACWSCAARSCRPPRRSWPSSTGPGRAGRWWPTCARWPAPAAPARWSAWRPRPRGCSTASGLAIVATPRERDPALVDADSQQPGGLRAGAGGAPGRLRTW